MNKRIYTLCLVLASLTTSIQAEELWVAGVKVSLGSDKTGTIAITGSHIKSGTVTYNYDTKTLTLNDATIERSGDDNRGLRSSVKGLTVKIVGYNNKITTTTAAGMRFEADATITGDGNLEIVNHESGIYVDKNVTLTINGTRSRIYNGWVDYLTILNRSSALCVTGKSYSSGGSVVVKGYTRFTVGTNGNHAVTDLKNFSVYSPAIVEMWDTKKAIVADVASFTWGTGMMITKPANAYFDSSKRTIVESGSSSGVKSGIEIHPVIPVNETYFPNANLRSWLKDQTNYHDGYLYDCDYNTLFDMIVPLKSINNLKGIEYLSVLRQLDCMCNDLNTLNVSKNTFLTYLECSINNLEQLDVSKNTYLTYLSCYLNRIKGAKMDALIASLPTVSSGEFCVVYDGLGEQNICTTLQVAAAKKKGWKVTCYKDGEKKEYAGSASGDANGDGYVTNADITSIVNYIIGKTVTGFKFKEADLNNDGTVDATDLVILINRLNGKW